MKKLYELFWSFLKTGAFTFGGGYAMMALLENEFVLKKKWIKQEEFLDMAAIAESTPGPIAINSATYIGYKVAGFAGALVSTIAVSLPSFFIIYIISLFFDRFLGLTYVAYAFRGIKACVVYLILSAGIRMLRGLRCDIGGRIILITVFCMMIILSVCAVDFSSIFYILISGMAGILIYIIREKLCKKEEIK